MQQNEIENNAQRLYFSYPNSYFANKNKLVEICSPRLTLLGYIVFRITDFCKRSAESKKIHDLSLKTLEAMSTQLDAEWPRLHFNGDQRFGLYPGCPVRGRSYKEFAQFIVAKHPLGKEIDIKQQANQLIDKFDKLPIFDKFPTLTRNQILDSAKDRENAPEAPSISESDIPLIEKEWQDPLSSGVKCFKPDVAPKPLPNPVLAKDLKDLEALPLQYDPRRKMYYRINNP